MDPLAHTLFGACLAKAGLERRSPLALGVALVGANAPDVDVLSTLAGRDAMYGFRRGWTHGVVAVLVLPWVLVGAALAWDAWRRRRHPDRPPIEKRGLLLVAFVAVLSHPLLDWLNNYGVRALMPFSDRWFYGDALFIVDPWMWLLTAAAVVMAASRSPLRASGLAVLGVATTALVTVAREVPTPAKVVWCVALCAIVVGATRPAAVRRAPAVARGALLAFAAYVSLMLLGSALARGAAARWLGERGVGVDRVMAGPMPANPFTRDVVAVGAGQYHFLEVGWLPAPSVRRSHPAVPIGDGPDARAALSSTDIAGFARWLRFPTFVVEPRVDGRRVWIRDVRYSRSRATIGTVSVDLDADGRPVRSSLR